MLSGLAEDVEFYVLVTAVLISMSSVTAEEAQLSALVTALLTSVLSDVSDNSEVESAMVVSMLGIEDVLMLSDMMLFVLAIGEVRTGRTET